MKSPDEMTLLVEVARLYYEHQLTQSEIGRRVKVSRSTVSRLLQQARDTGVVKISIDYNAARDTDLEQEFCERFALKDARILRSYGRSADIVRKGMGQLAAQLLEEIAVDGMVLGTSYGRSLLEMISQLDPPRRVDMTVIQIIGALGSNNPLIEGIDLTRELANKFGGKYRYLHAPLMVEDPNMRDRLTQEPTVRDVLTAASNTDCIVIGIGALNSSASGLIWSGFINRNELSAMREKGAVGHMCAQFFDIEGNVLDVELNRRSISIGLEALHKVDNVIAVAGTEEKSRAILGALNGGYIGTLITDDQAARAILSQ